MIAFRPFQNSDPPHLVRIWNSQPPRGWLSQPLSLNRLEQFVLCRPYFRPDHLLLATRDDQPVGFVHIGFGPTADGTTLDTTLGSICGLFVLEDEPFAEIATGLLARAEEQLRRVGATRLSAGGLYPVDPFYWGFYGGPLSAGIPVSDADRLALYCGAGYQEVKRYAILERPLLGFRPPVDRCQLQIKRKFVVDACNEVPTANWWEACVYGQIDRARYTVRASDCSPIDAWLTFWDRQHLFEQQGKRIVGLLEAKLDAAQFQDGMAAFLIADSLRQLQPLCITHVDAVVAKDNADWTKTLAVLGFQEVEQTVVLEKD